ncbi:maleylpyruvate isomerase family mycothiol-dependent enzyme [Modestobacter sp. KNN46-3]|uniref:maleylpyruvate isomerase family mycothiol-dependent enzyme n=1 Tax=Modestobacter sp. KNN46-3 TaxID=2711218 RepID=UPI0013E03C41|nr:maleylpyruvate isomerase family mycothiol-dependent enzyme [Modestobacter sp. KNN46-3]
MDGDELWTTIDTERSTLADLLEELAPAEWEHPSLCAGWRVRDVAAHLTLAHTGAASALPALVRARGSFDRMVHDTACAASVAPPAQLVAGIRAMVGSRRHAVGTTQLEPLIDVLVHGQDIAVPLGRERAVPPAAAAAAATRVWSMGWPFWARRRLRGVQLVATDSDWHAGSGPVVQGSTGALLMVLTGRRCGVAQLSGPGVSRSRARAPTTSSRMPTPV